MANDSTQLAFDAFQFLWHTLKHIICFEDFADQLRQGSVVWGGLHLLLQNLPLRSHIHFVSQNSAFHDIPPPPFGYF